MTSILSRKGLLLFTLYNMLLHHLSAFIHTKHIIPTPTHPTATYLPSPTFRRLQSFFTVGMKEDSGGIFGLDSPWPWNIGRLLHSPYIVGDFGYGWWYHVRKLGKVCARMLLKVLFYIARIVSSVTESSGRWPNLQL